MDQFIHSLSHPKEKEINQLREIILKASSELSESIKWNGPNYSVYGDDRITLKINPPGKITVVFHCGAAKGKSADQTKLEKWKHYLDWKDKDRALMHFQTAVDISTLKNDLSKIVQQWIEATG